MARDDTIGDFFRPLLYADEVLYGMSFATGLAVYPAVLMAATPALKYALA